MENEKEELRKVTIISEAPWAGCALEITLINARLIVEENDYSNTNRASNEAPTKLTKQQEQRD